MRLRFRRYQPLTLTTRLDQLVHAHRRSMALLTLLLVALTTAGSATALELEFERLAGSRAFEVSFEAAGVAPNGASVSVSSGAAGQLVARDGHLVARIEPDRTGRLDVTVEVPALRAKATRTALVLGQVDDVFNQPEPVRGLVNTPAWEDGAAISANGQWLAVQYFPVTFDCITNGKPDSTQCRNAIGPVSGPMRPDMPGASRVDGRGKVKNGCPSVGAESLSFPVPPTSLYLFKRQADGSFGAPSPVYWDGVDGCVTPYGPALLTLGDNEVLLLYAFDSPSDGGDDDTHGDLFAVRLDPRQRHALGKTESKQGKLAETAQLGTRIGPLSKLHAANPEGWTRPHGGVVVFYDDENVRGDLFYAESDGDWLTGQWGEEQRIPAPVSTPNAEESQPFFDGKDLYFRRKTTVYRSRYQGGPMNVSAAWAEPVVVLDGDRRARDESEIIGTGEPTLATVEGRRELYFIYAEKAADGSLNFDVGRVAERSGERKSSVTTVTSSTGVELPIASMQGIEGSRATNLRNDIAGAAGGRALVWDYTVKRNPASLLLLPGPQVPAASAGFTLSAHASAATTLGLMVSEKGGARYAVQVPWPAGQWEKRSFKWADFEFQSHGSADDSGRLEPGEIEALLVIDASGYQGKAGDRTLQIDSLRLDAQSP